MRRDLRGAARFSHGRSGRLPPVVAAATAPAVTGPPPAGPLRRASAALLQECLLTFALMRHNIVASVVPFVGGALHALSAAPAPAAAEPCIWAHGLAASVAYGILFGWWFDWVNQYAGQEEDALNKPDRPLPSGLVQPRGACVRIGIGQALFLAVGAAAGVGAWAMMLTALVLVHYSVWDKHWATKNAFNGLTTAAKLMTGALLTLPGGAGLPAGVAVQAVATGAWVAATVSVQDLRDMAGDSLTRRRTLPLVAGHAAARWASAAALVVCEAAWLAVLRNRLPPALQGSMQFGAAAALAATVSVGIAGRTLTLRTQAADNRTYYLYSGLVVAQTCLPGLLLLTL